MYFICKTSLLFNSIFTLNCLKEQGDLIFAFILTHLSFLAVSRKIIATIDFQIIIFFNFFLKIAKLATCSYSQQEAENIYKKHKYKGRVYI